MGFCPFFSHQVPFPCPEDISCRLWDGDCVFNRIAAGGGAVMKVSTDSYTGDGSDDRQIATGFKCSMVIVFCTIATYARLAIPGTNAVNIANGVALSTDALVHALDGFVVDEIEMNRNGYPYFYWAISE